MVVNNFQPGGILRLGQTLVQVDMEESDTDSTSDSSSDSSSESEDSESSDDSESSEESSDSSDDSSESGSSQVSSNTDGGHSLENNNLPSPPPSTASTVSTVDSSSTGPTTVTPNTSVSEDVSVDTLDEQIVQFLNDEVNDDSETMTAPSVSTSGSSDIDLDPYGPSYDPPLNELHDEDD